MSRPRQIATVLHRWTGLFLAGILIVVGFTGAILAWNDELERVFAPSMFVLPISSKTQKPLDVFTLREVAERRTGFPIDGVDWTRKPDEPARFSIWARPGGPKPDNDEIALDPFTGEILGQRRYGDISQGTINLMPFVYRLHDTLLLGPFGIILLGVAALLWTIDCFVGAYLTFPARARTPRGAPAWLKRWLPAWRIRSRGGKFKIFYDLHRAGGLWPWALMLILAWSSVSFNLPQVYRPIMAATLGLESDQPAERVARADVSPRLGWREAHRQAMGLMSQAAKVEGFVVRSERLMFYDAASHAYTYRVLSTRDPGSVGNTQIKLDGDTGKLISLSLPTGRVAGTTVTAWIGDIHVGNVLGITMKIMLTLTGLGVVSLSVTGVWLWNRKRTARSIAHGRHQRVRQ